MAKTKLKHGPFPRVEIKSKAPAKPFGVYLIGRRNVDKAADVFYVGRSDERQDQDLRSRLKEHDKDIDLNEWPLFKYQLLKDEDATYERESRLYHHYSLDDHKRGNDRHPSKPSGREHDVYCPVADCEYSLLETFRATVRAVMKQMKKE